jgi:hypothetical protein
MVINERRKNNRTYNKYKLHYKVLSEIHEYHSLKIHWGLGAIMYKLRSIISYERCKNCYESYVPCRCKKIWKEDGYYMLVIYGKNSKNNEISFLGSNYQAAWYRVCDIKERMYISE